MSRADLPVLTGLTALSLGHAVLHLADGSSVTVGTEPSIFLPSEPPFALGIGDGEHRQVYAVPDHLHATVCAALNLYRFGEPLPRLTLTGIDRQPDAVTFQAVNQEGQAVNLTMPRPLTTQLDFNPSSLAEPLGLYVTSRGTLPGRGFRFEIYPETSEGSAVLELLGWWTRVEARSEGHILS